MRRLERGALNRPVAAVSCPRRLAGRPRPGALMDMRFGDFDIEALKISSLGPGANLIGM